MTATTTNAKQRKYDYLHVVQGNYGAYGWEDVAASEDSREARANLREDCDDELSSICATRTVIRSERQR